MARHDIRGLRIQNGTYALTAKDIYNVNDNFIQLSQEIFGNSSFTRKIEKRVTDAEGEIVLIEESVQDLDGNLAQVVVDVNGIETRVQNTEGDVSTLQQTATSLQSQITSNDGDISTLTQTANSLTSRISDAEGDISTLTQTASSLQSQISNNDGDISTLTQTANSLTSRISDAEGDISSHSSLISQNATNITTKVSSTDYTGAKIASKINQSASTIKIEANHIKLEGLVTANTNFKILTDGSMEAKNAKLSGELNTYDGSGRATRIFNRNLAYYSPINQSLRGMISSSKIPNETTEGLALLLPKNSARDSYFSIATLDSYNDTTGIWSTADSLLTVRRTTGGAESINIYSDFWASRTIQRGFVKLNASSPTSVTFSPTMQGNAMVVLTPTHNITGAVITAKVISTSSTGFSAIIQGSPTSSDVYFYWIAIA